MCAPVAGNHPRSRAPVVRHSAMRADGDALARGGAIRLAIEVRRRSSAIGPRSRAARDGAARRRRDATRDRTIDGSDATRATRGDGLSRDDARSRRRRARGAPWTTRGGARRRARARRGSARRGATTAKGGTMVQTPRRLWIEISRRRAETEGRREGIDRDDATDDRGRFFIAVYAGCAETRASARGVRAIERTDVDEREIERGPGGLEGARGAIGSSGGDRRRAR